MPGIKSIAPPRLHAVAGDDWWMSFTLYEDGSPVNLSGATIQASVRNLIDNLTIPATTQYSSSAGASWSTGVIIVTFPNSLTVGLPKMEYFIEIDVYLNNRYSTWPLVPVEVIVATITH